MSKKRVFMGNTPSLVVGDPELIKIILVKDFHVFNERGVAGRLTSRHPIGKRSVANLTGPDWQRVRSITSPGFTSGKMKRMYPLMQECLNDIMDHLEKKYALTVKEI